MDEFEVEDNYILMNHDSISYPSLNDYLNNLETDYNYDPFILFKNFIISDIIPKFDNLVDCTLFKEDEYGEPINDYYIKFIGDLSFSDKKQLRKKIIKEIMEYANDLEFFEEFKEISYNH